MRGYPICIWLWMAVFVARLAPVTAFCEPSIMDSKEAAVLLTGYFEAMSVPKPFHLLEGAALQTLHRQLRERLLADVGLDPLPERIDLDVHRSKPIAHPWCTIEMIEYQLWPGVYSQALLLVPKEFQEKPAPAVLCPHGHWDHHFAHPDVQKRLLVLAKMGYVVLSPRQNHYENLLLGFSNQTLMIWTNMRGIDLLQSLPEVDPARIGAAGASGGGLQTQMLAALDDRVQAATIVGMTCDFREILFPHAAHCRCNHWPRAMAYTDAPEISALAFPSPVQYLVMNDWTRHFPHDNFPKIQELYRLNGFSERVSCTYWPTGHTYDRKKRERTYWWMERWLRNHGSHHTLIPTEPEEVVTVFPPQLLDEWPVPNPGNKGLEALAAHIHDARHFKTKEIHDPTNPIRYKRRMRQLLPEILGLGTGLAPRFDEVQVVDARKQDGVTLSRVRFPSEGNLQVPALIVAPAVQDSESGPVTLILDKRGMSGIETLEP
ncbi:MAG: acetylxylan esterase, partial [Pirellulales bacterium]|nr:acetylxylan esterase [Pirellulales bacterium]